MNRSHHELLLARGWVAAGVNRYEHEQLALAVVKLASSAGGGWAWHAVGGRCVGRYPSRLSAAKAAQAEREARP